MTGDHLTVGTLALQGAFEAHQTLLRQCGVATRQVRTPTDLAGVDALVMPGGESTTMSKLLMSSGLPEDETPCTRAAFAEELDVHALATNGYDRLAHLDAPRTADPAQVDLRAFAITPA